MIKHFEFSSGKKGKSVLFFGAIHGNETCGPQAIERVAGEISSGELKLQKGKVAFVPICNPRAHARHIRYTDENLNRIFKLHSNPTSYEQRLANELCAVMGDCDAFLDIHSTSAPGEPYFFIDYSTRANKAFAAALGPRVAIVGWPKLDVTTRFKKGAPGTLQYAHLKGKAALLVECGQHDDPASVEVAYRSILNTLRHFGVLKGAPPRRKVTGVRVKKVFFRQSPEDRFAKNWTNLQKVKKGEILFFTGATQTAAPCDGYVLLPNAKAPAGEEWLYLGRKA